MLNLGDATCFVDGDQVSICQGRSEFSFQKNSVSLAHYHDRGLFIQGTGYTIELRGCEEKEVHEFVAASGVDVGISSWKNPAAAAFRKKVEI